MKSLGPVNLRRLDNVNSCYKGLIVKPVKTRIFEVGPFQPQAEYRWQSLCVTLNKCLVPIFQIRDVPDVGLRRVQRTRMDRRRAFQTMSPVERALIPNMFSGWKGKLALKSVARPGQVRHQFLLTCIKIFISGGKLRSEIRTRMQTSAV